MRSVRALALLAVLTSAGLPVGAVADGRDLDCTLSQEAFYTYLDLRSPSIAKVIRTRREKGRFEQAVRLTSGTNVTFAVYGCTHHAFKFSFRVLTDVTRSTPLRTLARIALEQLATVPVTKTERAAIARWKEVLSSESALADAERTAGHYEAGYYALALPDDFANYSLSVPEPGVIEIEYDFPM